MGRRLHALGVAGIALGAGLGVSLLVASPTAAELFRCTGPDGRTTFSDNPAACPGAKPHESRARIQSVPSSDRPPPAPPARSRGAAAIERQLEADREQQWRAKKQRSESELRALEAQQSRLQEYVTWCNRGGELISTDETGIRSRVSCDGVRRDLASLEGRIQSLRSYLNEGLAEECRRAGCLPGWIR